MRSIHSFESGVNWSPKSNSVDTSELKLTSLVVPAIKLHSQVCINAAVGFSMLFTYTSPGMTPFITDCTDNSLSDLTKVLLYYNHYYLVET